MGYEIEDPVADQNRRDNHNKDPHKHNEIEIIFHPHPYTKDLNRYQDNN